MQKQLVLAALFATAQAATCADANTAIAQAAQDANTAAKAGLDAAKKIADQAVTDTKATYDLAVKDEGTWTTAMSAFVAEQLKATNEFKSAEDAKIAKKKTMDALDDGKAVDDADKDKNLPVAKLAGEAAAANTKATANTDAVTAADGTITPASIIFRDEAAKAILESLKKNTEEHETLKNTAFDARATALSNWDAKNVLAAASDATSATGAATLKFKEGKIIVRGITAGTATGAAEDMRKCTANGVGESHAVEANHGTVWNLGSHNQATGQAPASGEKNAATEYAAEYLNCTEGTPDLGYTKQVDAAKLISAGAPQTDWLAA